jgi:hypothetical protein
MFMTLPVRRRVGDNVNKRDLTALVCLLTSTRFTMRYSKILALLPALLLCAAPTLSQAAVDVSFSVNVAPPELPIVYEQPELPDVGYIWTPGYWAWDGSDYYWVPGTWVLPPASDLYWTPGYWGWRDGFYGWNPGYWGPQVGYYGGVNYGFGYTGVGFEGGYWHGGAFFYNHAVANFGHVNIVNVYNTPVHVRETSRVSFNGGQGGLRYQPNAAERTAMNQPHRDWTPVQHQHEQRAATMPAMHVSQNGGHPQILTTQRAGDFAHPGPGLRNHQQPRDGQQPHVAGPGPAMRGPGAAAAVPTPDRQPERQERGPRPEERAQQPQGGQPREQAPRPEVREQAPRPEAQHEQARHEPAPKHEEPKHDEPKRDR